MSEVSKLFRIATVLKCICVLMLVCAGCFECFGKAGDYNVSIGGKVNVQYGNIGQRSEFNGNDPLHYADHKDKVHSGIVHDVVIKFRASASSDAAKYGGVVDMYANTSQAPSGNPNIAKQAYIYVEGNVGRIEAGSMDPIGSSMEVNGYSIAPATGLIDGDYTNWMMYNGGVYFPSQNNAVHYFNRVGYLNSLVNKEGVFIVFPKLPLQSDYSKSGKINYFSPKYRGFSFGVSYVPNSSIKGTAFQALSTSKNVGGYRHVFQAAVRYDRKINENVEFAVAVVGEVGKANAHMWRVDPSNKNSQVGYTDRHNLAAWQIGASIKVRRISFAGGYGNLGKSGTSTTYVSDKFKKGGSYWNIGSTYTADKCSFGVGYMNSRRAGFVAMGYKELVERSMANLEYNKYEAISIGADYKWMPGIMPYIEVTRFNFKHNDNFSVVSSVGAVEHPVFNKGTVFLAGTKVSF